ncbi:MAG: hypothetical protein ABIP93_04110 [Gemmatimonadaceae bacterium]
MSRIAAFVVFAALVSCGGVDTSTNPSTSDVAGTYAMRRYDGQTLPAATAIMAPDSNFVLDETYTLTTNARFTALFHTRKRQNGNVTFQEVGDTGTFTRNGVLIQLNGLGQTITIGEFRNDTLRLTFPGKERIYTK